MFGSITPEMLKSAGKYFSNIPTSPTVDGHVHLSIPCDAFAGMKFKPGPGTNFPFKSEASAKSIYVFAGIRGGELMTESEIQLHNSKLMAPLPRQKRQTIVITDSEDSVINSSLEYIGDDAYIIRFTDQVIYKDLECTIKWHEEE